MPEWVVVEAVEEQSDLTSYVAFDRQSTPDANLILQAIRDAINADADAGDCKRSNSLMRWLSDKEESKVPKRHSNLATVNRGTWKVLSYEEEMINGFECVCFFSYNAWA